MTLLVLYCMDLGILCKIFYISFHDLYGFSFHNLRSLILVDLDNVSYLRFSTHVIECFVTYES